MNAATLVAKPLVSNTQFASVLKQDKNPLTPKHHQGQERLRLGSYGKTRHDHLFGHFNHAACFMPKPFGQACLLMYSYVSLRL